MWTIKYNPGVTTVERIGSIRLDRDHVSFMEVCSSLKEPLVLFPLLH